MVTEAPSTIRVKRLRERRSRGVIMVAPVEVSEGGLGLLVSNGLLKEHKTRDRKAVGEACLGHAFGAASVARSGSICRSRPRRQAERLTHAHQPPNCYREPKLLL